MATLTQEQRQELYFEREHNRYAHSAIVDPPLHTALELRHVLDAVAHVRGEGPVVDFGAGTGRLSIALAREGHDVIAVDLSRSSLSKLQVVASALGLRDIAVATEIPDGDYPAIVGADVLHHVRMDTYLPRIRAALRDGARGLLRARSTQPGVVPLPAAATRHEDRGADRDLQHPDPSPVLSPTRLPQRHDHRTRNPSSPALQVSSDCVSST